MDVLNAALSRFSPTAAPCFLKNQATGQIWPTNPIQVAAVDFLYRMVKAVKAQKNYEFWRDNIFGTSGRWTVEARILNERTIFTADPGNIKAMLATQFSDHGKGPDYHAMWKDFLGNSIFATDGEMWSASRKLVRPQFTRDRLSDLECFEAHMQTLFRVLDAADSLLGSKHAEGIPMSEEKVIDIRDLFYRFTFDVQPTSYLDRTSNRSQFAHAFDEVQRMQTIFVRSRQFSKFISKKTFRVSLNLMNGFIYNYVRRALSLSPQEAQQKSQSVLRDQIVGVLLAGRDTTAATLSWALYELSRQPEAVALLRSEILQTVGSDAPTYDQLKNMPYLKALLNETLRIYPAVPYNVRVALEDTTLPYGGGSDGSEPIAILKNTKIAYSTLILHRRRDLYPATSEKFADPTIFSPDRWQHWHPNPHDYIPFNAGPRICVGQQFALTEMPYVLCRLFQRFEKVESHMQQIDGGDPTLKADIILSPGDGVWVSLNTPRQR
ncbi:uncharacterized protein TRUGW13939_08579 [Talaromyces rugulosus]|uniref:Cytochrome P450 n=1 Tax=Talaromyces rugulosus TaxID=121627 RepID=A0A7H8R6R7_TALRU|nr:uncharacterized protein TRUGW13939_08579 [Talaromyces rugulosus]QKX61431.1 hypothetical protein TRUGW13939_08579 [Talaromyces rugulosus]